MAAPRCVQAFPVIAALAMLYSPVAAPVVGEGLELGALIEADWIEQDRQFGAREAEAPTVVEVDGVKKRNKRAVTTAQDAAGGNDGIKTGVCGFHTASGETDPWWQVDLGKAYPLDRVVVFNRTDNGNAARTKNLRVLVSSDGETFREIYRHTGKPFLGVKENAPLVVALGGKDVGARFVRLMVPGRCSFALDEIEVYATDDPTTNIALYKPADQKSVGPYSYPGTKRTRGGSSTSTRGASCGRLRSPTRSCESTGSSSSSAITPAGCSTWSTSSTASGRSREAGFSSDATHSANTQGCLTCWRVPQSRQAASPGRSSARLVPVARGLFRRPHDPVRLHAVRRREARMVAVRELPPLPRQRRRHRLDPVDRWRLERVRPVPRRRRRDVTAHATDAPTPSCPSPNATSARRART